MAQDKGHLTDLQLRQWIKAGKPLAMADGDSLTFTLLAVGTAGGMLSSRHDALPSAPASAGSPVRSGLPQRLMGRDGQSKHRQAAQALPRRKAERLPGERMLILCEGSKREPGPSCAPRFTLYL